MQELKRNMELSEYYKEMKQKLADGKLNAFKYKRLDELLYYKGWMLIDHNYKKLIHTLLHEYHSTPLGGHHSNKFSLERLKISFIGKA